MSLTDLEQAEKIIALLLYSRKKPFRVSQQLLDSELAYKLTFEKQQPEGLITLWIDNKDDEE